MTERKRKSPYASYSDHRVGVRMGTSANSAMPPTATMYPSKTIRSLNSLSNILQSTVTMTIILLGTSALFLYRSQTVTMMNLFGDGLLSYGDCHESIFSPQSIG